MAERPTPPDSRQTFAQKVAEKLIAQLEAGTAPWQKPWDAGTAEFMPFNPTTGNRYKGINALMLMAQGREDPRWMTYKQATEAGAQVRKGEKGTGIQYWQFTETQQSEDAQGNPVKVDVRLERPRVFFATVFNGNQIDGLPPLGEKKALTWNPNERAESILAASGADIRHSDQGRAYYQPGGDFIHLPNKQHFSEPSKYYATALHEAGHWTGHSSRLDRDLAHPFGSEGYAREELRAEIASMILGNEIGIGHDPGQHAAYVGSWVKALKEDPLEIFRAAADAEKIMGYVLTLEQRQQQQQEQGTDLAPEAARVNEVRQREDAQAFNAAATPEDAAALRSERRTAEAQAERAAERANQGDRQGAAGSDDDGRTFIDVPFKEKEQAKALGAKWDRKELSWYVPQGVPTEAFAKWAKTAAQEKTAQAAAPAAPKPRQDRTYLAVPYAERAEAKARGALWDKAAKSWYAPPGASLDQFVKWAPEKAEHQQAPAMTPREEFAAVLRGLNMDVYGGHPIMDGKSHRIPTKDDKKNAVSGGYVEQSGFYVAHLDDGRPAGYAKNNRSGEEVRWKAKGYHIDDQQKAALAAQSAANQQRRAQEVDEQQEQVAQATAHRVGGLQPLKAGEQTAYLAAKGVTASAGIFRDGDATVIPVIDTTGKVWSAQTIGMPGLAQTTKSFAKGGRKAGCFHALGGLPALAEAPAIIIAEGYATAASLRDGAGCATVCAFDAGNLPAVAKALAEKFPDKPIIIAGEINDHKDVGRRKAEEAAAAVGGVAAFPIFLTTDGAAKLSDFNDLASESAHGREAVSRQIRAAMTTAQRRHTENQAQRQEQARGSRQDTGQEQQRGRTLEPAGASQGQRLTRSR